MFTNKLALAFAATALVVDGIADGALTLDELEAGHRVIGLGHRHGAMLKKP